MNNNTQPKLTSYNKKLEHSYAFGAFPTIEMLKARPRHAKKVLYHSDWIDGGQLRLLRELCDPSSIPLEENDRAVARLRQKDSCLVIGVFEKYASPLKSEANHLVLVHPSDMGNMGTIVRTCIGFGVRDLAVIKPAVDVFHPKVVRASMGSLFRLNYAYYPDFEQYRRENPGRNLYSFLSNGRVDSHTVKREKTEVFSAIFGNESSGLDDSFLDVGTSVRIPHSSDIDSLNLSLAVGIGLYALTVGSEP